MYDTGGSDPWDFVWYVKRVSREITARRTLAVTFSGFTQKETHFKERKEDQIIKF